MFDLRQEDWDDHFSWDGATRTAKTAEGRATQYVLGINLPGRVRLRQMLIDEGVFPP